jgi:hypothetical protein
MSGAVSFQDLMAFHSVHCTWGGGTCIRCKYVVNGVGLDWIFLKLLIAVNAIGLDWILLKL